MHSLLCVQKVKPFPQDWVPQGGCWVNFGCDVVGVGLDSEGGGSRPTRLGGGFEVAKKLFPPWSRFPGRWGVVENFLSIWCSDVGEAGNAP